MADDIKNLHVRISGLVQGVFFRANIKKVADILGLRGYVQNEPNGDVTVVAEGEDEMVNKLVDYCHQGPPEASVSKVSITLGDFVGFDDFDIRG